MLRKEINGVVFLEFELFQQFSNLKHGVFLRHGGSSEGKYESLNLSDHVADDQGKVLVNFERVAPIIRTNHLLIGNLAHGKTVIQAKKEGFDKNFTFDAAVTNEKGLALMMTHADCQVALFYDAVNKVLANVHSGWRGSSQNIYKETIDFMKTTYGSNPTDLYVGITPSLGPEHSEFIHYKKELPENFWSFQVKPFYFDLWEISRMQLLESLILPDHIEIARICTYSNPDDFFSYRRDIVTGRNGTFGVLT